MSGNRISIGFLSTAQIQDAMRRDEAPRAPFGARLMARLLQAQVRSDAGGGRARSRRQRTRRARGAVDFGRRTRGHRPLVASRRSTTPADRDALLSSRVPLNVPNIAAAEDRIDQVTLRLHSPRPVTARGVARLRLLLADGAGPMYRYGRGDLEGRLGAALAAL